MAFFKKKIGASELAMVLGRLALDPDRAEKFLSAFRALEINSQEEKSQVLSTMIMLELFATDYAVTKTLGRDTPEKNAVLDHLYGDLKRITTKTTTGATFFDALKEVFLIYTTALQTPHEQGPLFNIGKEFAKLCGKEHNAAAIYFGTIHFTSAVDSVSNLLKKYRIKI